MFFIFPRQTLSELDVWEVEARFSFLEHTASNGDKVPLIKDWKDVLSKIGDNQVREIYFVKIKK